MKTIEQSTQLLPIIIASNVEMEVRDLLHHLNPVEPLKWGAHENLRPDIQADIVSAGDYVISCRPGVVYLSFRPTGQHSPLGSFPTLAMAKRVAERHHREMNPNPNPPVEVLVARADQHFQTDKAFARKIRSGRGREWLYTFMRHWLAGMLIKAGCPREALPHGWANGQPLASA